MRSPYPIILLPLIPTPAIAGAGEAVGNTLTMLFGLGIVLAALYGTLILLKRVQQKTGGGQVALHVIGATAVGPRERVVLVEIADRVLVLGVAPGRVTHLDSLAATEVPRVPETPNPLPDFQAKLNELLKGIRRGR